MELHAVVEAGWIVDHEPPWPFAAQDWSVLRVSELTPPQIGYVVALLVDYNSIPLAASAEEVFANIASTDEDIVLPGGVEIVADERVIRPGCCSGLEDWSGWLDVRDGGPPPFMGHTPDPWLEPTEDGVRIWSDDITKPDVFHVDATWETYERAVASLRDEVETFLRLLEEWANEVAPENAARALEKVRHALRL
jgi:hypothetical protein